MDSIIHGVAKSWTRLSNFHSCEMYKNVLFSKRELTIFFFSNSSPKFKKYILIMFMSLKSNPCFCNRKSLMISIKFLIVPDFLIDPDGLSQKSLIILCISWREALELKEDSPSFFFSFLFYSQPTSVPYPHFRILFLVSRWTLPHFCIHIFSHAASNS